MTEILNRWTELKARMHAAADQRGGQVPRELVAECHAMMAGMVAELAAADARATRATDRNLTPADVLAAWQAARATFDAEQDTLELGTHDALS